MEKASGKFKWENTPWTEIILTWPKEKVLEFIEEFYDEFTEWIENQFK